MSPAAAMALARVGRALLVLLEKHPARKCETVTCNAEPVLPRLGMMDTDRSRDADAAVYECACGWVRHEPLRLQR